MYVELTFPLISYRWFLLVGKKSYTVLTFCFSNWSIHSKRQTDCVLWWSTSMGGSCFSTCLESGSFPKSVPDSTALRSSLHWVTCMKTTLCTEIWRWVAGRWGWLLDMRDKVLRVWLETAEMWFRNVSVWSSASKTPESRFGMLELLFSLSLCLSLWFFPSPCLSSCLTVSLTLSLSLSFSLLSVSHSLSFPPLTHPLFVSVCCIWRVDCSMKMAISSWSWAAWGLFFVGCVYMFKDLILFLLTCIQLERVVLDKIATPA